MRLALLAPTRLEPRWWDILDSEERARAQAFRHDADCRDYVAAHALARRMLGRWCGLPPQDIRFARPPGGRPLVAYPAHAPGFSLTHTAGLAACVLCDRAMIGLDAERIRPCADLLDILRPDETAQIRCDRDFFRLWTLKEAVLKATGEGLSRPPHSLPARLEPLGIEGAGPGWHFLQTLPTDHHVLTLAVRRSGINKSCSS